MSLWVVFGTVLGFLMGGGNVGWVTEVLGRDVEVSGVVGEDPEVDGGKLALRLEQLKLGGVAVESKMYVQMSVRGEITRSDRVVLSGRVSEGFGAFAATMWRPVLKSVARPDPPDVALLVRDWFGGQVRKFIPEPQVDLALGYLLGQKRALPEELSEMLSVVGLTHVVVASGYNLAVLASAARRIFGRVSRFAAMFFAMLLVVIFMGITGFSPSMTRAGLVAMMSLVAWYVGRKFHPVKLLLMAAAITLLINPGYILDLGWLLSFAAFAGVMLLAPLMTVYFYGEKKPNFVAGVVMETLAAQICCLPIVLYASGSFSIVSVVANVLILPTVPVVMLLSFLAGGLAFIPPLAGVIGWMANVLLSFHIGVVEFFGSLEWALVEVPAQNPIVFLGYAVIVGVGVYMGWRTKYRMIKPNIMVE